MRKKTWAEEAANKTPEIRKFLYGYTKRKKEAKE